ncbi:MAG: hypothetical protein QM582_15865 [Micropruina sp.]|uniref:hypothetical protein n=1 Tax=Micropruina sp. TaxID=2737536 RepID=UPI0039E3F0B0
MEPVLRDLRSSGIEAPRIEDDDWSDDPEQHSAMMWSRAGNGAGVSVLGWESRCERIAAVADQVQDWAIMELWGREPTNWPPCPRHPDSHPMTADCHEGAAVWRCPSDQVRVAEIATL